MDMLGYALILVLGPLVAAGTVAAAVIGFLALRRHRRAPRLRTAWICLFAPWGLLVLLAGPADAARIFQRTFRSDFAAFTVPSLFWLVTMVALTVVSLRRHLQDFEREQKERNHAP